MSKAVSHLWPCLLWLGLSLGLAAAPSPCAMVTDLVGSARQHGQPLALFAMLSPGCELELPAGSRLQLAFVNGGLVVSCVGPGVLRVEADGAHLLRGAGLTSHRPPPSAPGVRPTGINWDRMAGVRRGDLALICDPASLSENVRLAWKADRPLEEVEIVIEAAGSFKRAVKQVVPAEPACCEVALLAGGHYLVTLTGFAAGGERLTSGPLPLYVLSPAERAKFEEAWSSAWEEARREPQSAGGLTLLLVEATDLQLYSQAREVAAELARRRPDAPGLTRLVEALRW